MNQGHMQFCGRERTGRRAVDG